MARKQYTLCIPVVGGRVLLGLKKTGDLGQGLINAFGGKVNQGETIEAAAARELEEEVGITPVALDYRGVLEFTFADEDRIVEMHIFTVSAFTGEPQESNEMRPEWFSLTAVPFDRMWPADQRWLPLVLEGKKIRGQFHYSNRNDRAILHHTVEVLT